MRRLAAEKLKNFKKHCFLFWQYFKMRTMDEMEAGWAFVFIFCGVLVSVAVSFLFFKILFLQVSQIGGWNYYQVLVLLGTYQFVNTVSWITYARGYNMLSRMIEFGDLDMHVVRPINLRGMLIYHRAEALKQLPDILFSFGIIIYAILKDSSQMNILAYLFFVCLSIILHYSFVSLISSVNFFKIIKQTGYFAFQLNELGKFPITIYKGMTKIALSIMVPVLLVFSIPVQVLYNQLSWQYYLLTFAVVFGFYILSRVVWSAGLKRYESAQG